MLFIKWLGIILEIIVDYFRNLMFDIPFTVWEEMSLKNLKMTRYGHLGCRNGTILAILNLYVAPMPRVKLRLNPSYGLGGDVVWRISRWPLWRPSWIPERNHFSNSESLCCSDASYQSFGSIWLMVWEEVSFEEFQDVRRGCHLGYRNRMILANLNLYVTVMPPVMFQLNSTYGLGEDIVWRISRWLPWRPYWISEQNNFSNSE